MSSAAPSASDAAVGQAQIEWVRRHAPVLDRFVRERLADGALDGVSVAVVVHLEAKTAFLATVLADAGAHVLVAGSNPRTTRHEVVAALRTRGLSVYAETGGDQDTWERDLLATADAAPEYLIDDGAELTMRMARHRPDQFARVRGVSEQTTTGTARLESLAESGRLRCKALTANNARCKHLFDNVYGTGQTTLQALAALTGRQIAAASLAVIGYGYVGRGIAQYARAMGARTSVVETDPVRALQAHMDGHAVGDAETVLPLASAVVTATGRIRAVGDAEIRFLRDDVVLANAGHHDQEIDVDALRAAATATCEPRDGVETFRVHGRVVHLLTGGALVNIAGGAGHPVEVMDLSFAVQALGLHHLVTSPAWEGVRVIPAELDDAIASAKLASLGIRVPARRPEQHEDLSAFVEDGVR